MVTNSHLNDRFECMDSYRLLEFSGSESENDILHLTSVKSPVTHQLKKKRLKRKERDLLRSSGTLHTESSYRNNKCSLYCSNNYLKQICGGSYIFNAEAWEYFRSIILVVSVIGLSLVTWLALHLQFQLDVTQSALAELEASGSELPAKFHESHVRLQQLEKNHTSLWASLATITTDLSDVTEKLNKLESSVKTLQESLSGSPQLTSLPKDVASIQGSVATFGSTLQDVQSAVKVLKEEQTAIHYRVDLAVSSVTALTSDVQHIYNSTHLPPTAGGRREGERRGDSIGEAFLALQNKVTDLSSSVVAVNASVASRLIGLDLDASRIQKFESFYNSSIDALSKRVNEIQLTCSQLEKENLPTIIANITSEVSTLKESSNRHYKLLQNITQNVAVVKGVEKKLEGSQLQMASGVTDLKQQLQMLEKRFSSAKPATPTSSPSLSDTMRIRTREIHLPYSDSDLHPRRRRGILYYP